MAATQHILGGKLAVKPGKDGMKQKGYWPGSLMNIHIKFLKNSELSQTV